MKKQVLELKNTMTELKSFGTSYENFKIRLDQSGKRILSLKTDKLKLSNQMNKKKRGIKSLLDLWDSIK